jgi:hypothetical protein
MHTIAYLAIWKRRSLSPWPHFRTKFRDFVPRLPRLRARLTKEMRPWWHGFKFAAHVRSARGIPFDLKVQFDFGHNLSVVIWAAVYGGKSCKKSQGQPFLLAL